MAIKDSAGQKTTAKKLAQDIIMDGIALKRGYWRESEGTEGMTEREIAEVERQLKVLGDRVARMFGFDESWIG